MSGSSAKSDCGPTTSAPAGYPTNVSSAYLSLRHHYRIHKLSHIGSTNFHSPNLPIPTRSPSTSYTQTSQTKPQSPQFQSFNHPTQSKRASVPATMSGQSSVGQSSVYEAGDQRNAPQSERETAERYNEGKENSHKANDSSMFAMSHLMGRGN